MSSYQQQFRSDSGEEVDDNFYVVQKIIKKKYILKNGRKETLYFVRWKDYPNLEDHTWEPISNLKSVQYMINQFEVKWQERKANIQRENQKKQLQKKMAKEITKEIETKQIHKQNEEQNIPTKKIKKDAFETKIVFHSQQCKKEQEKQDDQILPKVGIIKNEQQIQSRRLRDQMKSKPFDKVTLIYGKILNHMCKNGELSYEVQLKDKDNKTIKLVNITSEKAHTRCLKSITEYLQLLLIDLQKYNKSL